MPQLRQLWEGNFSGMLCWEGAWLPTQPGAPGRAVLPPKEQTVLSFGYFWLFSCCPMSSSPWLNPATHLSLCGCMAAAGGEAEGMELLTQGSPVLTFSDRSDCQSRSSEIEL